jgi:hypothetical protein
MVTQGNPTEYLRRILIAMIVQIVQINIGAGARLLQ